MKKLAIAVIILGAASIAVVAQPRAIGGRVAYTIGPSYQHSIGEKNMLQADLDFVGYRGIQLTGTYNWIFPITSWTHAGSWNLYAGVGAGGGFCWGWGYRYYYRNHYFDDDGYYVDPLIYPRGYKRSHYGYGFIGVAGMFGAEYNFTFPLQLFAEYRPLIGPAFYQGGFVDFFVPGLYTGFAVGARYRFGK